MGPVATFRILNIGALSANKFWGEEERTDREISATCTLLDYGGQRLIVDPSPHPERLAAMLYARSGLRPDAIDAVFLTHFHGDHRFGLALFEGATWMMAGAGLQEWREKAPQDADIADRFVAAEGRLPDGVTLRHAPGHTPQLYALQATTPWGILVVAGDAVMNREYFAAGEGYRNSVDFEVAAATIRQIKAEAALVIPGHDNVILNAPSVD
jgi:glyoxylase-like metal-dependent hydrolase (beta-lactamase superfamily II)